VTDASLVVTGRATTYTWNEDNRLITVTLPDGTTVAYTYDSLGRLLTRTKGGATILYVWDGMDLIAEIGPTTGSALYDSATYDTSVYGSGGFTRYNVVNGEFLTFERDGAMYAVIVDALGSVRKVVDESGATVFSATYDAWGNALNVTDDVPGGMPYRYVGAYGVRWDADTGLHYMQNRWYDGGLQRFVGRDALEATNRYEYGLDNPVSFVDLTGLAPRRPPEPGGWGSGKLGDPWGSGNPYGDYPPSPKGPSLAEEIGKFIEYLEVVAGNILPGHGKFEACLADCIQRYDPTNLIGRAIGFAAKGVALSTTYWPKTNADKIAKFFFGAGGRAGKVGTASDYTTLARTFSVNALRGSPELQFAVRQVSRTLTPWAFAYGLYMAVEETGCLAKCLKNPCS
jgi:RHS repeat-associated protein